MTLVQCPKCRIWMTRSPLLRGHLCPGGKK
jgi:hypothetical protein